ncbi:Golgi transport complex subunit 6 [Puccinia graminis f. sp. tritici]|uniref:Conserved oligomeric Golgi complex subunit 6 n=2 Tax=Puccinia graminis f. sp. tritici TaxID=56615 RepID=A0A5B0Q205_PUCGR|nr:Golgi transport complex subunit 6 [Puccinia graminis f. sp. tritici]KAA1124919.1 Golgi transport complex subunit 6, variant 2 [Puccinia graminis f. sp. tritici]
MAITNSGSLNHQPTSTSSNNNSTTNALSLRISKVLATSQFDDPNFRQALDTLNSLTFQNPSSPHVDSENLGAKASEIDCLQSLKKGGLRRIVEQRIRNRSREFLNVFSELNDDLIDLQSHLDQMHECCDEIQENLKTANSATKYLLEHAEGLRKEDEAIAAKRVIVKAFLEKFTLNESEIQALTSREVTVNWSVFEAMEHCEQIRSDCATLLTGDSQSPKSETAGLDIMQATSKYLDKGYEKVLKWALFECRSGLIKPDEAQPEVSPLMKRAINRLKRRPESLEEVINTLTAARSSSLSGLFLEALTRGGPSGLPRPIELIAHDPIRYVGDMLAWIHQVMASEHEFLESLFDLKADGRRVGESRIFPSNNPSGIKVEETTAGQTGQSTSELTVTDWNTGDREMARKLLDKHLEGCIRPLKIRVQQTVNSQEGSLIACQLASLLEFYQLTMAGTIGPDAKLTKTLSELTDQSYEVFYQLLRSLSSDYLKRLEPPPVDLSVPAPLREAMSNLSVIMSIYEGSTEDGASSSEHSFERVLDLVVDPMMEVIDKMARLRASEWDRSIFWLNCLEFMLATLDSSNSTSTVDKLESLRQTHLEKLIQQYTAHLTSTSGLEPVLKAIETKDQDTPLSRIEEANSKSISEALKKFDKFLMNFDTLLSSNKLLSLLNTSSSGSNHSTGGSFSKRRRKTQEEGEGERGGSQNLKEVILKRSLNDLVARYQIIYDNVLDDRNLFEFKSTILIRSLDEVKTLIGFL